MLGYRGFLMLSPADAAHRNAALIDTDAAAADLARLAAEYSGRERELRTAVAQGLKSALAQGADARRGRGRPECRADPAALRGLA